MCFIHCSVFLCTKENVNLTFHYTINNAQAEIVNKSYTHRLQGFAGYIKTKILQLYKK